MIGMLSRADGTEIRKGPRSGRPGPFVVAGVAGPIRLQRPPNSRGSVEPNRPRGRKIRTRMTPSEMTIWLTP